MYIDKCRAIKTISVPKMLENIRKDVFIKTLQSVPIDKMKYTSPGNIPGSTELRDCIVYDLLIIMIAYPC